MTDKAKTRFGAVPWGGLRAAALVLALSGLAPGPAAGEPVDLWQAFWSDTWLVGVSDSTPRSEIAASLRRGSYELSDGTRVRFDRWYRARGWREVRADFLTRLTPTTGLTWGVASGERGLKYRLDPSLRVGLLHQIALSRRATVSLAASTGLGGALTEKPCIADYGAIGGIQTVNCRLAATPLPPSDTLAYLLHMPAAEEVELSVIYELRF